MSWQAYHLTLQMTNVITYVAYRYCNDVYEFRNCAMFVGKHFFRNYVPHLRHTFHHKGGFLESCFFSGMRSQICAWVPSPLPDELGRVHLNTIPSTGGGVLKYEKKTKILIFFFWHFWPFQGVVGVGKRLEMILSWSKTWDLVMDLVLDLVLDQVLGPVLDSVLDQVLDLVLTRSWNWFLVRPEIAPGNMYEVDNVFTCTFSCVSWMFQ